MLEQLRTFGKATLFDMACCGKRFELTVKPALPPAPTQDDPALLAEIATAEGPEILGATQTGGSSSSSPSSRQRRSKNEHEEKEQEKARSVLNKMKDVAKLKLGNDLSALAAYVPSAGLDLLKKTLCMPKPIDFKEHAVAAIFDLSGFTKMCADLSQGLTPECMRNVKQSEGHKQVGVLWRTVGSVEVQANASEAAKKIIDQAFSKLIDVIVAHGGDILRIAGDALIVMFTTDLQGGAEVEGSQRRSAETERDCAQRAAHCAHECVEISRRGEIPMQVHIGMSFGILRRFHVGGVGTWQVVVAGRPMEEAGEALDLSSKLETVVTASFAKLLEGSPGFRMTSRQAQSDNFQLLECTLTNGRALCESAQSGGSGLQSTWAMRRQILQAWSPTMPEVAKRALRAYVPDLVLQGTVTGLDGSFAEIRKLVCVFIDINLDLSTETSNNTLKLLQDCFLAIQRIAVVEYAGNIKELTCDDKGLVCVIGFGFTQKKKGSLSRSLSQDLKKSEGENLVTSAASACKAASRIEKALRDQSVDVCIGITTGMVYCAALGNVSRRELAWVSSTMNTAARLMSAVKKGKLVNMHECAKEAEEHCLKGTHSWSTVGSFQCRARMRTQGAKDAKRSSVEHHLEEIQSPKMRISERMTPSTEDNPQMKFSERILCTEDIQKEAGALPDLHFHEVSAIPLKGYTEKVPIFLIGLPVELGEDSTDELVKAISGDGKKEVSFDIEEDKTEEDDKDEDSDGNEEDGFQLDKASADDGSDKQGAGKTAADWREVHRIEETPLTYVQYCTLLPAYFGTQDVQQEVSDYIWVRSSGGNPSRVAELVRHFKEFEYGRADSSQGTWLLVNPGFPSLVEISSAVPGKLAQQLLLGVSELSPLNQLILKVIAVLGGAGTTDLIRHLLHGVTFLEAQWSGLNRAFRRQYQQCHGVRVTSKRFSLRDESDEFVPMGRSETSSVKHGGTEEVDVLVAVLSDLEDHGLIELDGEAEEVTCKDFLLIDAIYSNLTFSHRQAMHEAAAKWMRSSCSEVEGVISVLPNIIHHSMLGQQESKASGLVNVVKRFSGNTFLEHFIVRQVQWHLPLTGTGNDVEVALINLRAEQALPAIPSLRGLAKAMHQQLVGATVTQAVNSFKRKMVTKSPSLGDGESPKQEESFSV